MLNNSQISPPEVQLELPDAETVKSRQICKLNYNSELLGAETLNVNDVAKTTLPVAAINQGSFELIFLF